MFPCRMAPSRPTALDRSGLELTAIRDRDHADADSSPTPPTVSSSPMTNAMVSGRYAADRDPASDMLILCGSRTGRGR
jgi:hypothetical protein